ncbi:FHA domain-containing protein [Synechococcus sp. CS-1332]|uniref:FHA domain-containing protein n=1 Tax=Synechococcus sp. CS-1332 TaxID=2847972 RepID=UPI00223A9722|nr:FHA domain-containing protein [Synechococcus sp. CS-1332]MCT0206931.1 FHA domain-containing protein [Synechococcus sp. CS-1332]
MSAHPRLLLRDDPGRSVALDPRTPLSIGRDPASGLCLSQAQGVSRHHALVRVSRTRADQWLLCDLGSANGTYLEGARLRDCRPLSDGDEIRLGLKGPVLQFRATSRPAAPVLAQPAAGQLDFAGRSLPLDRIRSAYVRSRRRHPQAFSWWLLLCLGGLLLLPFPWLFWPLQLGALAGWILLGSRWEHLLEVTLQDGLAYRHRFDSLETALAHRNGIRKAMGAAPAAGRRP